MLFFLGVMGRVAIETADIATGVGGFGEMRLLMSSRRGSSDSERWSPAVTFPRTRISWFCRRRPPRGPLRDRGSLRNLAVKDRPSCSEWSSSAASSPKRCRFPRDRSCRSRLPHTWTLRGKAYRPPVRRPIEHSGLPLADQSGREQRQRRKERRSNRRARKATSHTGLPGRGWFAAIIEFKESITYSDSPGHCWSILNTSKN